MAADGDTARLRKLPRILAKGRLPGVCRAARLQDPLHKLARPTMNTYSHVIPAMQREAAAKLDSLLRDHELLD